MKCKALKGITDAGTIYEYLPLSFVSPQQQVIVQEYVIRLMKFKSLNRVNKQATSFCILMQNWFNRFSKVVKAAKLS